MNDPERHPVLLLVLFGLFLVLYRPWVEWLRPHRAFRMAKLGPVGVNPDQRLHEDTRHLTELSSDLGVQLLQATILLVTFVDVLWRISGRFVFHWGGQNFSIPGYMVWAAIVYASSGSLLSYWVGRGLIRRNADRYQRESELRTTLNHINEHIDQVTLQIRELEFIKLAASELTYKEIATQMCISIRTVDGYRDQLFEKLGVKSCIGLVLYAIKHKLIEV